MFRQKVGKLEVRSAGRKRRGLYHCYEIVNPKDVMDGKPFCFVYIDFQDSSNKDMHINGITNLCLLHIVSDRLGCTIGSFRDGVHVREAYYRINRVIEVLEAQIKFEGDIDV